MTADEIVDVFVRLNQEIIDANPDEEDQKEYPHSPISLGEEIDDAVVEASFRIFQANEKALRKVAQEHGPVVLLTSVMSMGLAAGIILGRQEAAQALDEFKPMEGM